jgi:hypothetical protein
MKIVVLELTRASDGSKPRSFSTSRVLAVVQLPIQLAGVGVTLLVSVVGTALAYGIVWVIGRVVHLDLRVSSEDEIDIDSAQHRESAYATTADHQSSPRENVFEHASINMMTSLLGNAEEALKS